MRRNQPVRVPSLKDQERYPSQSGTGNSPAQDGYSRLSSADRRTGIRQPIGGSPEWPPYHEDT